MAKKALTTGQTALLDTLMGLEPTARVEELGKLGLTCDMTEANLLYTERMDLMAQIAKLQEEHAGRVTAERAALEPCVRAYTPLLEVGWFDRKFIDNVELSYALQYGRNHDVTIEGTLTKCNRGEPLTGHEVGLLQSITYTHRTTAVNQRRINNLLYVNADGEVCGRSYCFSKAEARRLCDWACGYWRGENKQRVRNWVHRHEEHGASISQTHVAIGCQTLAREEVTRIAALFGFADVPKQVGPEVPGKEEPKPRAKKTPTTRSRAKREPVVLVVSA